jgi:Undecaprenyl-phosphate glucose phosphotransferase
MLKEHSQLFVALMGLLDLAVTCAAWGACYVVRFHTGWFAYVEPAPPPIAAIADVIVITLLLVLLVFARLGMYQPRRLQSLPVELFDILRACVVVWVVQVVISHFLHSAPVSRKLQGMFLVVWPAMLIAYRGTARVALAHLRRRGRNLRSCAVVGAGRLGQTLVHTLRAQRWRGYHVAYFLEDRRVGRELLGVPVRGPVGRADDVLAEHPVDAVFIALERDRADEIEAVLGALSAELVDLNVVPDLLSYHFLRHDVKQLGPLPIVNLTHSPQSGWHAAMKRIFDVVFSAACIVLLSPMMLAIAAAIKLTSPGRVFYCQRRASLGGREFIIVKFRSMVENAEAEAGATWGAARDDPRVTPVGRLLRRFSLDELPQLFNVLVGQMSLVGPRPERPEFIERFSAQVPRYMLRHHVKAGMTGWAQVNGYRGRSDLKKRIQYDLYYINNWSFGFDVWILVLTAVRVFVQARA